jgi:hypothetical protein
MPGNTFVIPSLPRNLSALALLHESEKTTVPRGLPLRSGRFLDKLGMTIGWE